MEDITILPSEKFKVPDDVLSVQYLGDAQWFTEDAITFIKWIRMEHPTVKLDAPENPELYALKHVTLLMPLLILGKKIALDLVVDIIKDYVKSVVHKEPHTTVESAIVQHTESRTVMWTYHGPIDGYLASLDKRADQLKVERGEATKGEGAPNHE